MFDRRWSRFCILARVKGWQGEGAVLADSSLEPEGNSEPQDTAIRAMQMDRAAVAPAGAAGSSESFVLGFHPWKASSA